ncbi:MAG: hypothetical protein LBV70_03875, partial [Candidatus Adiutrix sp.]|nr:hypothetical protein [Candidatus Adiutrix sp.]
NLKLEYANFADRLKTLERLNLAEELSILHQEIGTLALENRKIKSQMAEMAKSLGFAQEARETGEEDEDDLALDSEIFDIEHPLA